MATRGTWKMNLMVMFVFPVFKKMYSHFSFVDVCYTLFNNLGGGGLRIHCIFMVIFVLIKFTVELFL